MYGIFAKLRNIIDQIYTYLSYLYVPQATRWQRYGLVILLVLLFFLLKITLTVTFQKEVPFLFSLFIVILSAWFGGVGPGLFATLLSGTLTFFFFLDPKMSYTGSKEIPNYFFLLIFFIEGVFISLLSESRRKSDRQKSEFMGVVSHELKNPLTSVKGYSELIEKIAKQKKELKLTEFAQRINAQINQITEMINDLLDITKIETGRLTYHDELFDFGELIGEIVTDQQVTTSTHKLFLKGKTNKPVYADRHRIGQVVTNLISNSIKYSPNSDRVLITVSSNTDSILVKVKDFGVGVSIEDQKKLFLPYFRANNSTIAKGTGIGLFITSEIVRHYGGKLSVKSKIGKGSQFTLQLPVHKQATH